MLSLRNIGLKRGEKWIFRNVNLSINQGELLGIIGVSGAGKSSLLNIIAGLLDATEGEVYHEENKLIGPSIKLIPGYEEIQLVNQDFGLDVYHSVEENVKEKVLHLPYDQQNELIDEVLDLVDLKDLAKQKAHLLSGGEQQRLSIARALACEPKVLLLDEPFVHLDQQLRMDLIGYILKLNEIRNTTIILVSHDGGEMMGVVNKMIYLKDGLVQREGDPNDFYFNPIDFEQGALLGLQNQLMVNGEEILFRPNEFELVENGIDVKFIRCVDTGLNVFNYFQTADGQQVILSSDVRLDEVQSFEIHKK